MGSKGMTGGKKGSGYGASKGGKMPPPKPAMGGGKGAKFPPKAPKK